MNYPDDFINAEYMPMNAKIVKRLDALWSEAVKSRDNHRCRACFHTGTVEAHHLVKRQHKATRWLLSNGITLCLFCHDHEHSNSPRIRVPHDLIELSRKPKKFTQAELIELTINLNAVIEQRWAR